MVNYRSTVVHTALHCVTQNKFQVLAAKPNRFSYPTNLSDFKGVPARAALIYIQK